MAANGRWTQSIVGAVVIVVTVFSLLGLYQSIQALEPRVTRLENVTEQIDAIEAQLAEVQREAAELSKLRADILQAICLANARTPADEARCRRFDPGQPLP